VVCFKKHKETPCQAPPAKKEQPPTNRSVKKKRKAFVDEDEKPAFIVTKEQYARLGTRDASSLSLCTQRRAWQPTHRES
jgi:hypothetical protein